LFKEEPMRLFIAEKPELARAIVAGLGGGRRREGYFECGEDRVTWCYGHMLKLLEPEDYDPRHGKWSMDDLPIVHIPWRRKPAGDATRQAQLKIILSLLAAASSVVHAGDPDEEGQLLVDEILAYAGNRLPVSRLLINDNNINVVRRQLEALRDNRDFAGLSAAAEARCIGDQLYGFNMTRGYTLAAQARGHQGVVSVGRVQTPILGLVVRRCRENAAHRPVPYLVVEGLFVFGRTRFSARYRSADGDPVDGEGRLSSADHARRITDEVQGGTAIIRAAATRPNRTPPPLPYNLLKLQIDASRQFGLKPDQVKAITQVLREKHRLITYNRSDCEYLSEEQHADAPAVLAAIAQTAPNLRAAATRADPSVRGRAFNSEKVSAHHAIIPTGTTADFTMLTEDEQRIYLLIARAYIAQFWPDHRAEGTEVLVEVAGHRFAASATVTTTAGWKALYGNDAFEATDAAGAGDDLRALVASQTGTCSSATVERAQTRSPPLYTMPSLLADLTSVAKYIRDSHLRDLLVEKDDGKAGEHGGIGTPATRDTIIKALFDRGYLAERGNSIVATPDGMALHDALPAAATYPDMTAVWHEQQKAILGGVYDVETFVQDLVGHLADEIAALRRTGLDMQSNAPPCLVCGKPMRRIQKKRGTGFFWGCTGFAEGCAYTAGDRGGAPDRGRLRQGRRQRRRPSGRRTPARPGGTP
jgi:DNA topoisomerase III